MSAKRPTALILAAGKSSRFQPFCYEGQHKSMLRVAGRPILGYLIEELARAGIKEVVIVHNPADVDIKNYFRDGQEPGVKISYAEQPEPKGAGDAILKAEAYLRGDFFVFNPNHLNAASFIDSFLEARQGGYEGVLLGKKTDQPSRYGVFKLRGERIVGLIEKPPAGQEPSDIRIVGMYLLSPAFLKILRTVSPQEYSLEAALQQYFIHKQVRLLLTTKDTLSLKYPWDIFRIKDYILDQLPARIDESSAIAKSAILEGRVIVASGVKVLEKAVIKGPAYIGKNAVVGSAALLRKSDIEEGCVVGAFSEIKNSLLMEGTKIHMGFVGDSIVGRRAWLGAGFITANRRFDRQGISVVVKDKKTPTGLKYLGALIGNEVKAGIHAGTMPGVIISSGATIPPGTIIYSNFPEDR